MDIKKSLRLYKDHFLKIVILGLTIVFPFQFLKLVVDYVLYGMYGVGLIADSINGFFIFWTLSIVQIPFIQLALDQELGNRVTFGSAYSSMAKYGFLVYVMALLYAFVCIVGGFLFIIPGIILSVMLLAFPYVTVIEDVRWWNSFREAWQFGKENFRRLFVFILLFGIAEWAIEMAGELISLTLTNRYIVIALVQILLNMLLIPIYTFVITFLYLEWSGGVERIQKSYDQYQWVR